MRKPQEEKDPARSAKCNKPHPRDPTHKMSALPVLVRIKINQKTKTIMDDDKNINLLVIWLNF